MSRLCFANTCEVQNDSNQQRVARVLVGLGDDFESANAAVMYHAREIVAAWQTATGEQQKEIEALHKGDESTKLWEENWYDGLTYCELDQAEELRALILFASRHLECTWSTPHRGKGSQCGRNASEE
jgi:hypothetical protein